MNKKKWIVLFSIVGFFAVMGGAVLLYNYTSNYMSNTVPPVVSSGELPEEKIEAPDFTVYDTDGNAVKLSDFKGTPVVINFWATWCGYCVEEMPHFNDAYNKYSDVKFLMVNATDGQRETVEKALAFVEENELDFTPVFDSSYEAVSAYGASSLPTTIFVDKDGFVTIGYKGMISAETLEAEIEKIQ